MVRYIVVCPFPTTGQSRHIGELFFRMSCVMLRMLIRSGMALSLARRFGRFRSRLPFSLIHRQEMSAEILLSEL